MADNVGSKVTYFLVGLGVGALVGILFAPNRSPEGFAGSRTGFRLEVGRPG